MIDFRTFKRDSAALEGRAIHKAIDRHRARHPEISAPWKEGEKATAAEIEDRCRDEIANSGDC